MKLTKVFNRKLVLGLTNLLFLICGVILLVSGFYLLTDGQRVLLSRLLLAGSERFADLPQPLFYYIALGLSGAGIIAIFASMIGCWATCINTYCFLTMYFLIVLILLMMEFVVCLLISLWPQCLGLNLDETVMVKVLQGNYGVPGREQLTAAIDLAQTYFDCCAINSNINYDTSLWRLQGYGQREWTVPLTCCYLDNRNDMDSYLDPKPTNLTYCQSIQRQDYDKARHTKGCLDKIDQWYREQYVVFLAATLVVALVEFLVLLSIILNCTKLQKLNNKRNIIRKQQQIASSTTNKNKRFIGESQTHLDNIQNINSSTLHQQNLQCDDEIKEVYTQPPDLYQTKHSTSFKPSSSSKYQYQISKSYLV